MKVREGTNLYSLKRATDNGMGIILMLPKSLPMLKEAFNKGDLKDADWPEIRHRNHRTATRSSVNPRKPWCIAEPENWQEFQKTLTSLVKNENYPKKELFIGFGKYYKPLSKVRIPTKDNEPQFDAKEDEIRRELEEQARHNPDKSKIKSYPMVFNTVSEKGFVSWRTATAVLEPKTGNFYWLKNVKDADKISGQNDGPQNTLI